MNPEITPAQVSNKDLDKIRALEEEIGKVVLAVEPQPQYASLSDEQLDRLRKIEAEMGVVMVAFKEH